MQKADKFEILKGHVEADEAFIGGKASSKERYSSKTIVLGMKERGGRLETQVIKNAKKATLRDVVTVVVEPGSTVSTDEWVSYGLLKEDGGGGGFHDTPLATPLEYRYD